MGNKVLDANEQAILAAASQIFAGIISTGKVDATNDSKAFDYAINRAAKLAKSNRCFRKI